jgi:Na+-driven multidrug efflux pump
MSYTERLLYTSSPRHPGIFAPGTPTATPDMVAADECDGDEAGALVAAACTGTGTDTGSTQDAPAVRSPRAAWALFVEESRRLWAIGAPIALNIICLYGTNSTTQIFAGHIGNLELSAVAVGLSVVSNFSFGFLLGMGSALETLCGQAFGAGQVSMLGVYMQRSWIILAASAALLTPLYVYAAPLLRLLGQDPAMAAAAGDFTIAIIPQMFALALNFPAQKFLQAQSKVGVLAWIGVAALLAHVALLALFVTALGWGVAGAALAYDLSSWLTSLAQLAYVVGWCRDGWTGLSRAAFTDLWAFVRLSLASAVMLCLEMWYMMLLVVLTGHLDDAEIAVDSIAIWFGPRPSSIRLSSVLNTLHSPLLIMDRFEQHEHQRVGGDAVHRPQRGHQVINISFSVSFVHPFIPERNGTERTMLTWLPRTMHACSVRVSNELGSGRPRATKYAVAVVLAQSLALGLLAMALVLATRGQFPAIFTGDRQLQKAVSSIAYLLAVTMVLNSIQPVISGVAVGGGWQAVVAYINLGCYYAFGLPLGFIFGYLFRFGVKVLTTVY